MKKLRIENLLEMYDTGNPIYSDDEADFLSTYAPHSFTKKSLSKVVHNPNGLLEANQKLFDILIKVDISLSRNIGIDKLVREKRAEINPILRAIEYAEVPLSDDILETAADIKMIGSGGLTKSTPAVAYEHIVRGVNSDNFHNAKRELKKLFGDVPMFVYGSALSKEKPDDVDTMVIVDDIDVDIYRGIVGKYGCGQKIPISFALVPEEYLFSYNLSDHHQICSPKRSVLLNKNKTVYVPNEKHVENLRKTKSAMQYIILRESLKPENVEDCMNILPRINSRVKFPKYFHKDLNIDGPKPDIDKIYNRPTKKEAVMALAKANMQMYDLLRRI